MYTIVNSQDIAKHSRKWRNYKLCYIDEIPQTYFDYTPEAKAYRETAEWKEENRRREEKYQREHCMSSNDSEFGFHVNAILKRGAECKDYPNPQYIPGVQTLFAYFTPKPLDEQWGDDWDDAPYEYNAGIPYDDIVLKVNENRVATEIEEYEILQLMFYLPTDGWGVKFPRDYTSGGGCNSHFCVRDINGGAVAWIYYRGKEGKSNEGAVAIHAGCNPYDFMEKVGRINEAIGPYVPDEDDE